MMKVQLVGVALLVAVSAHPSPQETASHQTERLGPVGFPVSEQSKPSPKGQTEEIEFKCETPEGHEACEKQCRSLRKEYVGGRCDGKVCHCHLPEETHQIVEVRGIATVECERIAPAGAETESEHHKACKAHCQALRKEHVDGTCNDGVCYCREEPRAVVHEEGRQAEASHPEPKCEGKPSEREVCSSRCRESGHEEGHCLAGVCKCGPLTHLPSESAAAE